MKSFLNACGLREALRIVIEGPRAGGGESRVLPHPFAVIGRDERADVILDDPRVGRRHVYLQAVAGQVFWLDLESRTGICDETGTKKSGWLAVGGLLAIGPFVIRRDGDGGPGGTLGPREPVRESPLAVRTYNREPLPAVSLEFLNGPSQSTVWPMNRVMSLIGSAKGCKFRLTDPSVSAFHASLLRTPTGLWVVDSARGPQPERQLRAGPVRLAGRRRRAGYRAVPDAGPLPGTPGRDLRRAGPRTARPSGARRDRAAAGPRTGRPGGIRPVGLRRIALPHALPAHGPRVDAGHRLGHQRRARLLRCRRPGPVPARGRRIGARAPGQPVQHDAAADVRPVPAGHGYAGPDVRQDAQRADGGHPRGAGPSPRSLAGTPGVEGRTGQVVGARLPIAVRSRRRPRGGGTHRPRGAGCARHPRGGGARRRGEHRSAAGRGPGRMGRRRHRPPPGPARHPPGSPNPRRRPMRRGNGGR